MSGKFLSFNDLFTSTICKKTITSANIIILNLLIPLTLMSWWTQLKMCIYMGNYHDNVEWLFHSHFVEKTKHSWSNAVSMSLPTDPNKFRTCYQNLASTVKELQRVKWTYGPVEDQKRQLLSFSAILLEFCSILVKFYKKKLHFTEFHSL